MAGALVLLNSVLLMLQLEMEGRHIAHSLGLHAERQNFDGILPTFQVMDSVFVFIFLAELLIRIVLERWKFVKATCRGLGLQGFLDSWSAVIASVLEDIANWLDFILVAGGLVDMTLQLARTKVRSGIAATGRSGKPAKDVGSIRCSRRSGHGALSAALSRAHSCIEASSLHSPVSLTRSAFCKLFGWQVTLRFVSALKAFRAIRMVRPAGLKYPCVEHGSILARAEQRRERSSELIRLCHGCQNPLLCCCPRGH